MADFTFSLVHCGLWPVLSDSLKSVQQWWQDNYQNAMINSHNQCNFHNNLEQPTNKDALVVFDNYSSSYLLVSVGVLLLLMLLIDKIATVFNVFY